VRHNIGYVPQKDIIHMELTAYEALDFAAQLRMPRDTTSKERHQRVMEVLDDLDLAHRKDVKVSGLSGGQQKRVSIGVELLTSPGLFFLDEPTSGLDPGTETSLMQLMRRLADQGRTIVLVTHATKNVMLADKVLFMARGGYLAWFGPPDEALRYFDQYRSDRDRRTGPMEFDQIYAILDDPSKGSAEEWAQRYRMHPAYNTFIQQPLQARYPGMYGQPVAAQPVTAPKAASGKSQQGASTLRQFIVLSKRNFKILTRDRMSMILMLVAAPLVSLLDVLIAFLVGGNLFDYTDGDVGSLMMSFFLLIIFAAFIGALSQMREVVKEDEIYRRERLVNLKIMPYVASKFWIAALLALYHALAYTVIHYLAYDMPGGILEFLLIYVSMVFLAMGGMMLGLFASALAPSPNTVPMLVILLIMPMIVLSGALVPLPGPVSYPAFTRWALEGFVMITGYGSDVAADQCWQLPEELRDEMDIDTKTAQCNCMGLNVLDPESCNFPSIGLFADEDAFAPEPVEPAGLREKPADPVIPPAPEQPEDQSDSVAMAAYFDEVQAYQDDVQVIQDNYKADMELYQAEAEVYQEEMEAYQEDLIEWQLTRKAAVDPAEAIIETFYDEYGWAFVNKDDPGEFWPRLFRTWIASSIIIGVLLVGVIIMVKRKDAKK
jgi:ABC-type multidrug transport system ATPase subunit